MKFNNLKASLDAIVNDGYAPGVDCIVYKNHKMIYRYFTGVSDIENKIAMTGNELYYIFSMSKLITVVGALTLLEKGKYSLNDNLSIYMPEFEKMQVKTDKTELFDANEITSGKSFGASENKSGSYYKIKAMNKLNIAYFGGSITAGAGSDGKVYSWAYRTTNWFRTTFPNAVIKENNAAIGGTGTVFGVYRVIEDLKLENDDEKPDLVFIEFAINDMIDGTQPEDSKIYLETIIRIIYDYVPDADIMLLFTTDQSQMAENFEMRKAHQTVADSYKLPTLAIGELLIKDLLKEGNGVYTQELWNKYFADLVHPSRNGHAKYADYITKYIR